MYIIQLTQTFIWKLWGYAAVDTSKNEKNAVARHISTWALNMHWVLWNMEPKKHIL